jgi:endonuclease YncB( thermonuclease family)
LAGLVVVGVVIVVAWADRSGRLFAERSPAAESSAYDGATTTVVRVVDGDTLVVAIEDRRERTAQTRVRLWGVDAPELGRDGKPDQAFARDARAFVERTTAGRAVRLAVEPERLRDPYARVLAHVFVNVEGREVSVGEALVEAGLAEHVAKWSNGRTRQLGAAQRRARDAGRGMWSAGRSGPGASREGYTWPEGMRFNLFRAGLDLLSAG